MRVTKQTIITFSLLGFIMLSMAAIVPPLQWIEFKNLKVLPKNISEKALQKIMEEECNKGLGITCNYCHIKYKDSPNLDFASDGKPEKEMARSMMRMTMDINKKYFGINNPAIGDTLMIISCNSCHQGNPYPVK